MTKPLGKSEQSLLPTTHDDVGNDPEVRPAREAHVGYGRITLFPRGEVGMMMAIATPFLAAYLMFNVALDGLQRSDNESLSFLEAQSRAMFVAAVTFVAVAVVVFLPAICDPCLPKPQSAVGSRFTV